MSTDSEQDETINDRPTPFDLFRAYVARHLQTGDRSGRTFVDDRIWAALQFAAEMTDRDCPEIGFLRPSHRENP